MPQAEADSADAFASVTHQLDALLQAREARVTVGLAPPTEALDDDTDNLEVPYASRPLVDLPPGLRDDTPANGSTALDALREANATADPAQAPDEENTSADSLAGQALETSASHVPDLSLYTPLEVGDTEDAQPDEPSKTEVGAEADPDMASAVADIDALLQADDLADPVPEPAPDVPKEQAAASQEAGVSTHADDPTPHDLDAELEALLAEQPIDPEVLGAAEDIAKRDAEEAERNGESLRLRAEEAAGALAESAGGVEEDTAGDDITAEINDLLAAEEAQSDQDAATSGEDAGGGVSAAEDPTIDQIDQMLAAEAEDEDDLDGAFFSADDVAADNLTGPGETLDDEDTALAGSIAAARQADAEPSAEAAPAPADETPQKIWQRIDWRRLLQIADRIGLNLCWAVNWPACKFLSTEWRATLGYVALLQAAGALAVWLLLVVL